MLGGCQSTGHEQDRNPSEVKARDCIIFIRSDQSHLLSLGIGEARYCLSVLLHEKPLVKEERTLHKCMGPLYDAGVTRTQATLSERGISPLRAWRIPGS